MYRLSLDPSRDNMSSLRIIAHPTRKIDHAAFRFDGMTVVSVGFWSIGRPNRLASRWHPVRLEFWN